jgi:tellurite methyltransferase
MQSYTIQQLAGNTDIYLLDQIMKDRYEKLDIVLDAGCGNGRNLHWFLLNQIDCYGIDMDPLVIEALKIKYPILPADRLQTVVVENLPFPDHFFDHIISSAVLHFAQNVEHFYAMLKELSRVLKPGGTLFIRMASNIGMEHSIESLGDGVYAIPDGSVRFLLSKRLLENMLKDLPFRLIEPLKTVNVADIRCMTTLVMQKQ